MSFFKLSYLSSNCCAQCGITLFCSRYFQIVLSKQQNVEKPTNHPGTDLQPHGKTSEDNKPYITVELRRNYLNKNRLFTVGDDMTYVGSKDGGNIDFQNVKLEPDTFYSVFQRTFKTEVGGATQVRLEDSFRDVLQFCKWRTEWMRSLTIPSFIPLSKNTLTKRESWKIPRPGENEIF